jgi:hypothetical protein
MKLLHGFATAMAEVRTQVVPQRSSADELFVNGLKKTPSFEPPHQNLWVNSGSGSAPRLWYKAVSTAS